MTTYYTAKDIAELTGLQTKHVWRDVKCRVLSPGKARGFLVLTQEQLDLYLQRRAAGYQEKAGTVSPWRASTKARNDKVRKVRPDGVALEERKTANGEVYLVAPALYEVPERWDWRQSL